MLVFLGSCDTQSPQDFDRNQQQLKEIAANPIVIKNADLTIQIYAQISKKMQKLQPNERMAYLDQLNTAFNDISTDQAGIQFLHKEIGFEEAEEWLATGKYTMNLLASNNLNMEQGALLQDYLKQNLFETYGTNYAKSKPACEYAFWVGAAACEAAAVTGVLAGSLLGPVGALFGGLGGGLACVSTLIYADISCRTS